MESGCRGGRRNGGTVRSRNGRDGRPPPHGRGNGIVRSAGRQTHRLLRGQYYVRGKESEYGRQLTCREYQTNPPARTKREVGEMRLEVVLQRYG